VSERGILLSEFVWPRRVARLRNARGVIVIFCRKDSRDCLTPRADGSIRYVLYLLLEQSRFPAIMDFGGDIFRETRGLFGSVVYIG